MSVRGDKMKACGITAEYNPFHNGHMHQIAETKKQCDADVMIAVMSGSFTQRGEPAVASRRLRAEYAVRNGIDLVIELPYVYAVQSAVRFAEGAVRLLERAGVSFISFGSECGNLENLMEIAATPVNPDHIREAMSSGMSFPRAYSLLTASLHPNDLLAVCYLRAMRDTGITPVLVQRTSGYHDETLHETASALAIRTALKEGRPLQETTVMKDVLEGSFHPWWDLYYPYLRTFLLMTPRERLSEYFLFSEGIENHLKKQAETCADFSSFLAACISYRYTASRIRRTCLSALNQVTRREASLAMENDVLRILAFNDKGREWLRKLKEEDVRFASRYSQIPEAERMLSWKCTQMYASVFPEEERKRLLKEEITGALYVK